MHGRCVRQLGGIGQVAGDASHSPVVHAARRGNVQDSQPLDFGGTAFQIQGRLVNVHWNVH